MSYTIAIRNMGGYLKVETTGTREAGREEAAALELWRRVVDACHQHEIERILVVSHLTGALPFDTAFNIAEDPEKYGWERRFKLALVDPNPDSYKSNKFGETLVTNRGFRTRVFMDETPAREWLLESP